MSQPQRSGFAWRKATACGAGTCVEVARTAAGIAIRDSKVADGPVLHYTPTEWDAFLDGVKKGEFDDLAPPWRSSSR